MLNKKLKRMWIAALRSGAFRQERGALCTGYGYCCLGVLAVQAGAKPDLDCHMRLNGKSVHKWGEEVLRTDFIEGLDLRAQKQLANMNDGRGCRKHDFNEIADWIQKNL